MLENHNDTILALSEGIARNPENMKAFLKRGDEYFASGQYELAKQDYTRIIETVPRGDTLIYYAFVGRGKTYINMDLQDAAYSDYLEAILLSTRPEREYDLFYRMIVPGEPWQTRFNLNAIFAQHIIAQELYFIRGTTYLETGNLGDAATDYAKILSLGNESDSSIAIADDDGGVTFLKTTEAIITKVKSTVSREDALVVFQSMIEAGIGNSEIQNVYQELVIENKSP